MKRQIPLNPAARADRLAPQNQRHAGTHEVTDDLAYKRLALVNLVFFGKPDAGDREWVLIDTGIPGTARLTVRAASNRFGPGSRPAAILMTHGHFDHAGSLEKLAQFWDTPVYAHPLEHPYLNGSESYAPPDPTVGGGLMSVLSPMYPRGPIDVKGRLRELNEGEVPFMPGWKCVHTPGHSPGHVSFWREADRVLIAGDAFITTNQESAYAVAVQRPELHGPPKYYTSDWPSARESVRKLAALEPEVVVTGHGQAMRGSEMLEALHLLADDFDQIALPEQGRYVPAEHVQA
ncbi:MAG TPA: MBL fold metallo-hydrolase [Verrucomicrobiae bacterium]|nr:MBL fold metallo-hydrolase [Verrucomicrobiae bacterium]